MNLEKYLALSAYFVALICGYIVNCKIDKLFLVYFSILTLFTLIFILQKPKKNNN